MLGSPITLDALPSSFEFKLGCIQTLSLRLETLFAHDAFYLLRHCFSIPKLLYLLRTSPSWRVPGLLEKFDELIHTSLQTITNINISSSAWAQSILPAAKGGLGIRSAIDLSPPSYLSSLHSTSELVSSILTPSGLTFESSLLHEALDQWSAEYPMPPEDRRNYQHSWDELLYEHHFSSLLDSASDARTKARLLSVSSSESGVWLGALPVPSLGTKLGNESLRIALGLRLDVPIVVEHTCVCGSKVDVFGTHGLSCRRSGGRIPRHAAVNETIRRALVSGGVPAVLEPVGVCRNYGKRPDGMSLIP